MSVALYVFLQDQDVPSRDEWQGAINAAHLPLILDVFDVRKFAGYLPVELDGIDTGFEFFFGVVSEIPGVDALRLAGRDRYVAFVLHSDLTEMKAAMLAAATLTEHASGVFFDPQSGEYAEGSDVFAIIRRDEEAEVLRRRRLAEKDANSTNRLCPECGAKCPEYRKTCKVCGYEIGRVG